MRWPGISVGVLRGPATPLASRPKTGPNKVLDLVGGGKTRKKIGLELPVTLDTDACQHDLLQLKPVIGAMIPRLPMCSLPVYKVADSYSRSKEKYFRPLRS